jgi:hypothetical protein
VGLDSSDSGSDGTGEGVGFEEDRFGVGSASVFALFAFFFGVGSGSDGTGEGVGFGEDRFGVGSVSVLALFVFFFGVGSGSLNFLITGVAFRISSLLLDSGSVDSSVDEFVFRVPFLLVEGVEDFGVEAESFGGEKPPDFFLVSALAAIRTKMKKRRNARERGVME